MLSCSRLVHGATVKHLVISEDTSFSKFEKKFLLPTPQANDKAKLWSVFGMDFDGPIAFYGGVDFRLRDYDPKKAPKSAQVYDFCKFKTSNQLELPRRLVMKDDRGDLHFLTPDILRNLYSPKQLGAIFTLKELVDIFGEETFSALFPPELLVLTYRPSQLLEVFSPHQLAILYNKDQLLADFSPRTLREKFSPRTLRNITPRSRYSSPFSSPAGEKSSVGQNFSHLRPINESTEPASESSPASTSAAAAAACSSPAPVGSSSAASSSSLHPSFGSELPLPESSSSAFQLAQYYELPRVESRSRIHKFELSHVIRHETIEALDKLYHYCQRDVPCVAMIVTHNWSRGVEALLRVAGFTGELYVVPEARDNWVRFPISMSEYPRPLIIFTAADADKSKAESWHEWVTSYLFHGSRESINNNNIVSAMSLFDDSWATVKDFCTKGKKWKDVSYLSGFFVKQYEGRRYKPHLHHMKLVMDKIKKVENLSGCDPESLSADLSFSPDGSPTLSNFSNELAKSQTSIGDVGDDDVSNERAHTAAAAAAQK